MISDIESCYRLLEVDPTATVGELKGAYRDLVKVWHPDRFDHDPALQLKAQEKLKEINRAYETIRRASAAPAASPRTPSVKATYARRSPPGVPPPVVPQQQTAFASQHNGEWPKSAQPVFWLALVAGIATICLLASQLELTPPGDLKFQLPESQRESLQNAEQVTKEALAYVRDWVKGRPQQTVQ